MGINPTTTGQIVTGGNPILGAGTVNPLSSRGVPVDGVDGVAAGGFLTIAEPVSDGDQFTIDEQEYTLLDTPVAAYDIDIGGSEAATKVNIVAAINASGTEGVEYFAGTLIHPTVEATTFDGDVMDLTARETGTAGNSIVTAESGQELTHVANVFDNATLGDDVAGVDDVDGSYEGIILAGGYVNDFTNEDIYENTGTQAKPAYTKMNA